MGNSTKQNFASPLDFDPSYQPTGVKIPEKVFGASANALDTEFTGFSFCHHNYCDCLLHALVGHALQSANQQAALKKLQQHSFSFLNGLVGIRTGA